MGGIIGGGHRVTNARTNERTDGRTKNRVMIKNFKFDPQYFNVINFCRDHISRNYYFNVRNFRESLCSRNLLHFRESVKLKYFAGIYFREFVKIFIYFKTDFLIKYLS